MPLPHHCLVRQRPVKRGTFPALVSSSVKSEHALSLLFRAVWPTYDHMGDLELNRPKTLSETKVITAPHAGHCVPIRASKRAKLARSRERPSLLDRPVLRALTRKLCCSLSSTACSLSYAVPPIGWARANSAPCSSKGWHSARCYSEKLLSQPWG